MTTATIRIGDVVAPRGRQEHFARTNSGIIAQEHITERTLAERRGHEEWTHGIEEAWQGHLETLQQCVCELLRKNHQLRMALTMGNEPERKHGDAGKR